MVKENYAITSLLKLGTLLMCIVLSNNISAQCSLACNGTTQVSLGVNCMATITPEMILNDQATSCPGNTFEVVIMDQYNNVIDATTGGVHPSVGGEYCDQTLTVKIVAVPSGNSCWGEIKIEDKAGPRLTSCPNVPIEIPCFKLTNPDNPFEIFEGSTFTDACSGPVEPILISEVVVPLNCDLNYIKEVTRIYTAVDSKGNYAPECTVVYKVLRIDFDELECPLDYDVFNNNALSCCGTWKPGQANGQILDDDADNDGDLDTDLLWDDNGNRYPDVEEFPGPTIYGQPLFPAPDLYCNSAVFFDDIKLPTIGCVTKIMRTWYLREWHCGIEVDTTCAQIFEILDEEPPELTCTESITLTTNVTTNPHDTTHGDASCGAEIQFPLPPATDKCSENLTYDLDYPGGFANNYQAGELISLPMGENIVIVTVYDECYNSAFCEIIVNVIDDTPPVAICDEFTVVSLTNNGIAHVMAETFDDGSYDDCKLKKMLVRKMDPSSCDCRVPAYPDMTYFGEYDTRHYYLSHYPVQPWLADNLAEAMGGFVATMGSDDPDEGPWIDAEANTNEPYILYRNDEWIVIFPDGSTATPLVGVKYNYIYEVTDLCTFSKAIDFCCDEVGTNQMVVFRVIDVFGNYNECMVNAEVQDKLAPTVLCPPDMEVNCNRIFDFNDLDTPFGTAEAYGSCTITTSNSFLEDLGQCNTGVLKRIFTATNANGISGSCEQLITFVNPDPFTEDQIIYPEDLEDYDGCFDVDNYHPDIIGYPEFLGDQCDLVGANWDDQVFVFNNQPDQGCFKILREWSVIDWCQTDHNGNFVTWTHIQVIKVGNSTGPTLSCPTTPIVVCTFDPDCSTGDVVLTLSATDDCTELQNIHWSYEVDLGCNGTIDSVAVTQSGLGSLADASGKFPIGNHCIYWTFRDQCGNLSTCYQEFAVVNCKAPTPYCINGLAVDLMPMDLDGDGDIDFGMVELWASDFDAGSFHPCGNVVTLSFSADPTETNKVFDCTTLGDQPVQIWATTVLPDGMLIQAYCETFVNVQDNNNACPVGGGGGNPGGDPDPEEFIIEGRVATEISETVDQVNIDLTGANMNPYMTDDAGAYAFPPMPLGGSYKVDPSKNNDPLNGVSTLDIVRIQRHILGIEELNTPYKQVAADANKDYNISAADLIIIRKLILGIEANFTENESWVFIDAAYHFVDPSDALSAVYPEDYDINGLNADMNVDFVAVKVGDVDNTVTANVNSTSTAERSSKVMEFGINKQELKAGQNREINIYTTEDLETYGFQFTLELSSDIELLDISSDGLNLTSENFGYTNLSEGYVTVSWNENEMKSLSKGTSILTIKANIKDGVEPSSGIKINSAITEAELYTYDFNIQTPVIALEAGQGNEITGIFELFQNSPNPFTGATEINFSMPKDGVAKLIVSDVSGQVIFRSRANYKRGMNVVKLDNNDLNASGILYYTIETDSNTATKKMVVLK